jgi:hypothetical protein
MNRLRVFVNGVCLVFPALLLLFLVLQYFFYPWKNNIGAVIDAADELKGHYGSQVGSSSYKIISVEKSGESAIYEIAFSYNSHSGSLIIEYDRPHFRLLKLVEKPR